MPPGTATHEDIIESVNFCKLPTPYVLISFLMDKFDFQSFTAKYSVNKCMVYATYFCLIYIEKSIMLL